MSTTSLQKRTSVGAIEVRVRRANKFVAQLFLPKLANGRVRFDSNGNLVADDAPENFIAKSTTYTAKPGDRIVADTTDAAFTITLPATPTAGDRVRILDGAGTFDTNNLTLGRNGSKINSGAADLVLSTENALVDLIYVNSTIGWKAVYTASTADTLAVTGNLSAGGTFGVTGNLAVNTNKFVVTAANGNTAVAGTLGVAGDVTVNTNKFVVTAASGNTAIAGDLAIATNKFTVAAASGNTAVAGTLAVTGNATFSGALIGSVQALTGAGAVNVTTLTTAVTTTGANALTLADGTHGQLKRVVMVVDGGDGTLTPTTKTGFATITFNDVGDSVVLQFLTTYGWMILANNGCTVA